MGVTWSFVNFTGHWTHVCTSRHSAATGLSLLLCGLCRALDTRLHASALTNEPLYRITNEYRSYETGNDAFSIAACKGLLYYRVSAVACFLSCDNKPVSLIATIMIQWKIIIWYVWLVVGERCPCARIEAWHRSTMGVIRSRTHSC